jgi:hypothetical protein
VPRAQFTYEVRSVDQQAVGVEDYAVRASDGEVVGTVGELLDRDGERLLVIQSGVPPLKPVQRALPWAKVERVDHDALAVWLHLDRFSLEREALELDPELAREEGVDGGAEARRLEQTPPDLVPNASASSSGPVDRTTWAKLLALFALFALALLAATVVVTFGGDEWAPLFLVPAGLALALGALAFRWFRNPYERRAARKP